MSYFELFGAIAIIVVLAGFIFSEMLCVFDSANPEIIDMEE